MIGVGGGGGGEGEPKGCFDTAMCVHMYHLEAG